MAQVGPGWNSSNAVQASFNKAFLSHFSEDSQEVASIAPVSHSNYHHTWESAVSQHRQLYIDSSPQTNYSIVQYKRIRRGKSACKPSPKMLMLWCVWLSLHLLQSLVPVMTFADLGHPNCLCATAGPRLSVSEVCIITNLWIIKHNTGRFSRGDHSQ